MQLHFSVTFACCGNVEILVSTWYEAEVAQILKMILGKNYWCADSPGLQVYKSASLQVCKSAGLQVCKSASLQSASVAHRGKTVKNLVFWLEWSDPFFKENNMSIFFSRYITFRSFFTEKYNK